MVGKKVPKAKISGFIWWIMCITAKGHIKLYLLKLCSFTILSNITKLEHLFCDAFSVHLNFVDRLS